MSDTESFESVYERLYPQLHNPCGLWKAATIAEWLDDLERAHDREIRDTAQREYHRGFEDGKHSMDAEHRIVAMRLRALPLDGDDTYENLLSIGQAIWYDDFGCTFDGGSKLRDELVRLMGGVSEPSAEPMTTDEFIEYIEEDTRRLKGDATGAGDGDEVVHVGGYSGVLDCACDAVRVDVDGERALGVCSHRSVPHVVGGMVSVDVIGDGDDTRACAGGGACAADDCDCAGEQEEVSDERLADDCGADTGCGDCGCDLHMAGVTYGVLWNERHKAICRLREWKPDEDGMPHRELWEAVMGEELPTVPLKSDVELNIIMRDRLIHLLGGDQSQVPVSMGQENETNVTGNRTCPDCVPIASITDELRECVNESSKEYYDASDKVSRVFCYVTKDELLRIADHIDAQFNLYSKLWKRVARDAIHAQLKAEDERDELQKNLDELRGHPLMCPESGDEVSITDELREWASTEVPYKYGRQLHAIADRIDAQFDRVCQQQEAVLQEAIDSTHVELARDANGEVFYVGCSVRMIERHPEVLLTVHSMTLRDDGEWLLFAWDDKNRYSCNLSASEFEVCDRPQDTAESIVRDLSMGSITESEAIGRIEALNG